MEEDDGGRRKEEEGRLRKDDGRRGRERWVGRKNANGYIFAIYLPSLVVIPAISLQLATPLGFPELHRFLSASLMAGVAGVHCTLCSIKDNTKWKTRRGGEGAA